MASFETSSSPNIPLIGLVTCSISPTSVLSLIPPLPPSGHTLHVSRCHSPEVELNATDISQKKKSTAHLGKGFQKPVLACCCAHWALEDLKQSLLGCVLLHYTCAWCCHGSVLVNKKGPWGSWRTRDEQHDVFPVCSRSERLFAELNVSLMVLEVLDRGQCGSCDCVCVLPHKWAFLNFLVTFIIVFMCLWLYVEKSETCQRESLKYLKW